MYRETDYSSNLVDQRTDDLGLEDVAEGDPVEETEQGLQGGPDQGDALGVVLGRGGDGEGEEGKRKGREETEKNV